MSEILLKGILKLFSLIVRKEEGLSKNKERVYVKKFLLKHINHTKVPYYISLFDDYLLQVPKEIDESIIQDTCSSFQNELTRKQKAILTLYLMRIILADNIISPDETRICKYIAQTLSIPQEHLSLIENYITCTQLSNINDPHILVIGKNPAGPNCQFLERTGLSGFILVLHLSYSDTYFIKNIGETGIYINGIPQLGDVIHIMASGSSIRWAGGVPIYSGEIINCFKQVIQKNRIHFFADQITYQFSNGQYGLQNVSVSEKSGTLVAVMGVSGSGKSTLLHVLNGSERPTQGNVYINQIDIHNEPNQIKGVIGFVPQDDLLIEELTVWENIFFAARLCFDNLNPIALHKRVMKTLESLGLADIKDLKVGSPLQKTISGGQRKRLNLGLELVREPTILFVDEPTSGLSSHDSENIIGLLKNLTFKGKLIFSVIHQPSSDIYKLFDKLLILDLGGYPIYYAHPLEAISYFNRQIKRIRTEETECSQCGNIHSEQIFNIIESRVINEHGTYTNERKYSPQRWHTAYQSHFVPLKAKSINTGLDSSLYLPSRLKQIGIFMKRDVLSKLKNKQYLAINLIQSPLLAFILAYITRYSGLYTSSENYSFSNNPNIPAYLFMSIIVALFMGLTISAEEIFKDRKILNREKFLHLSHTSYLLSKITILFSLSALQTWMYVIIGNYLLEIHHMHVSFWAILFASACFSNMLGLNISSGFNSAVTIYIIIPILLIPQLVLSGIVIKFDHLNPRIGSIENVPLTGNLITSRWALEALMVNQFKNNRYTKNFYWEEQIISSSRYKKIYLIPELETHISYIDQNKNNPVQKEEVQSRLTLLKNELSKELHIVNKINLLDSISFSSSSYSKRSHEQVNAIITVLKKYYTLRIQKANTKKRKRLSQLKNDFLSLTKLRNAHYNEAVATWVKNSQDPIRIVRVSNHYVQKIFPIFKKPNETSLFSFNEPFFIPYKKFFNITIETWVFNVLIIWIMTIMLYIPLYYEWLRKVMYTLRGLTKPK